MEKGEMFGPETSPRTVLIPRFNIYRQGSYRLDNG